MDLQLIPFFPLSTLLCDSADLRLVLVTPEGYVHPTIGAQLPINVSRLQTMIY